MAIFVYGEGSENCRLHVLGFLGRSYTLLIHTWSRLMAVNEGDWNGSNLCASDGGFYDTTATLLP